MSVSVVAELMVALDSNYTPPAMSDPLVAACTHALLKKCGVPDDKAVSTLLRADGMISAGTLAQSMDDETVAATKAARMHLRIAVEKMEGLAVEHPRESGSAPSSGGAGRSPL